MFWLSFIPLYERLFPIFVGSGQNSTDQFNKFDFHDVPDFNVTSIYEETYLSDTIAIQLLQNFFNWFTATVVWFPFMGLYNRIYPIFAPQNNQRSLDYDADSEACTDALLLVADKLVSLLRLFAGLTDWTQRYEEKFLFDAHKMRCHKFCTQMDAFLHFYILHIPGPNPTKVTDFCVISQK